MSCDIKLNDFISLDSKNRRRSRFHYGIPIKLTETTLNAIANDYNIYSSKFFHTSDSLLSSLIRRLFNSYLIMFLVPILNLFFMVLLSWNESVAFNLQDGVPISSNPLRDSYFGYTVVSHRSGDQLQSYYFKLSMRKPIYL